MLALRAGNAPVIFAAGILVKLAAEIAGKVPVILAAGKLVRFAPDAAGKVAGNLASGTVTDVKLDALKAVKSIVSKLGSAPLLAL